MTRSSRGAVLLGAAIAVYANSVAGTFVLDDLPWIVDNPAIRDLWPPWSAAGGTLRPLLFYSLALNFAVSGLSPWSYHVVNAAIHSLAGLLLWGLLRRSLRLPRVGTPVAAQTESIAFATALLWLVHPLHTQAVTYVIQRGESMAAMWMLAALYAFVRGVDSDASQRWRAVVPIAWLAALATKEVAVVLPALVLAVDVLLVTGSLSQSLRRHRALYLTLGAPVALTLIVGLWLRPEVVAGLLRGDGQGISRGQYAASQAGVVLEYARLVLWPRSLSVDHGVPPVADLREALWPVVLVSAGLVATTWGLWRRRPVALLGIWPAVLLAPTSSVVPLRDLLVEHRMYLPAVAPLLAVVVALQKALITRRGAGRRIGIALLSAAALVLAAGTVSRNADYASELSLWATPAAAGARRYYNLQLEFVVSDGGVLVPPVLCVAASGSSPGSAPESALDRATQLIGAGRPAQALQILESLPISVPVLNLLGVAQWLRGDLAAAAASWQDATQGGGAVPLVNLGCAQLARGDTAAALMSMRAAVTAEPSLREARFDLGTVLAMAGRFEEAEQHLRVARTAGDGSVDADNNLGAVLEATGGGDEASTLYLDAASHGHPTAALNATLWLVRSRQYRKAAPHLDAFLEETPESVRGLNARGIVRYFEGDLGAAATDLQNAVEAAPQEAGGLNNLGCVRFAQGDLEVARRLFEAAVELDASLGPAHHNLGKLLAADGRPGQAARHLRQALRQRPNDAVLRANLREAERRAQR